jgi:glycine cleavage system T protein
MLRSPLFEQYAALQPTLMDYHGWEIPSSFGSVEDEYGALRNGAGLLDLSHRGRLLVRGADAPRFLHGMVSNEVKELEIGQGNYAFVLNPHGHILADLRVFRLDAETFLLDCEPQLLEVIRQQLDHHIIADAVELEDQTAQLVCLAVEGPRAGEVLQQALGFDPLPMRPLEHFHREDLSARILRASISGAEGYWILAAPETAAEFWRKANPSRARKQADNEVSVRPVGFEALEIRRIEAGIPRYGLDMDAKTLPQETGQMRALSFTKGCYIGQETVERIHSRGHVNRQLVGLRFDGKCEVARDMMVLVKGHPSGFITSAAYSFGLRRTIALAYLRRESAEPGTPAMIGSNPAEVTALPFPDADSPLHSD